MKICYNLIYLITPKKIQLFEEFDEDSKMERLFIILVRHRHFEMISDGNQNCWS